MKFLNYYYPHINPQIKRGVPLIGLEPTTYSLGRNRSIQMSYKG